MSFNKKGSRAHESSQQRTISKFFPPVLAPCNKKQVVERKKVGPVVTEHYDCFSGVYVNSKNNTWYYKSASGEKLPVDNHPFFCEKQNKILFRDSSGQLVDKEDEPVMLRDTVTVQEDQGNDKPSDVQQGTVEAKGIDAMHHQ